MPVEGRDRLRLIYRLRVVTRLPLLPPGQVARLPADFVVRLKNSEVLENLGVLVAGGIL